MHYDSQLLKDQGIDPRAITYVPTVAMVEDVQADSGLVEAVTTAISQASAAFEKANQTLATPSPVGENEKPRMLKLSAWLVHEGYPNMNGDAFVAEDLQKRVNEGLFQAPYFGMVDFNHDFEPRGVWYSAKYEYNEKAGQYGILVEGAIFAWKFPELADKLLAEQARLGYIRTSGAWISLKRELLYDEDEIPYVVHRDPVFFAHSVLDVMAADENSKGVGSEDTDQTQRDREVLLQEARDKSEAKDNTQEDSMDEKVLEQFEALLEEQGEGLREVMATALEAAEQLPQVRQELTETTEANESLTEANEQLTADLDEATTKVEALEAGLAEVNEELEALREFKAEVEAEKEEEEREALAEARLAELPKSFIEALDKKSDEVRERMVARYVDMDDEEFSEHVATLKEAFPSGGYTVKSKREGQLSGAADRSEGKNRISRHLR